MEEIYPYLDSIPTEYPELATKIIVGRSVLGKSDHLSMISYIDVSRLGSLMPHHLHGGSQSLVLVACRSLSNNSRRKGVTVSKRTSLVSYRS